MEKQQVACVEGCLWASELVFHSGDRGKDWLGEGRRREKTGEALLAQSLPTDPNTRTSYPIRTPGLPTEHQSPEGFQRQTFQAGFS